MFKVCLSFCDFASMCTQVSGRGQTGITEIKRDHSGATRADQWQQWADRGKLNHLWSFVCRTERARRVDRLISMTTPHVSMRAGSGGLCLILQQFDGPRLFSAVSEL